MRWPRLRWVNQYPEDREYPDSLNGKITFNPIQEREVDLTERELSPLELAGGTDPNNIVPNV